MKQVKNNNVKLLPMKVNKDLDKYVDMGLFQHKVDKANHILKTVGLPKPTHSNSR